MVEKRSFQRLAREWEIAYQVPQEGSSRPIFGKGTIRDFGGGGFGFSSDSACPIHALIQFSIKPINSIKPMVGVARIAWTRKQAGHYECGTKFVWVNWKGAEAQAAIAQYVLENMYEN